MHYTQEDFTEELLQTISSLEKELLDFSEDFLDKYDPELVRKYKMEAEFELSGTHPFKPGYRSAVSVLIADEEDSMLIRTISIWSCTAHFLGIPVSAKIIGSKLVGELLDDSAEFVKNELRRFIRENMGIQDKRMV
ncbi:hypothetical protein SLL00_11830 [Metabacillus indicus]|uniref:hypothetical protein n=1 Tax=Metabacillus indicus TaxID=246786 RepID=UPI002A028A45|nr:hypothetical protein [Metabacillus indicus]MDX8290488.1 hypothetical protein [Metabacillus indicus]